MKMDILSTWSGIIANLSPVHPGIVPLDIFSRPRQEDSDLKSLHKNSDELDSDKKQKLVEQLWGLQNRRFSEGV